MQKIFAGEFGLFERRQSLPGLFVFHRTNPPRTRPAGHVADGVRSPDMDSSRLSERQLDRLEADLLRQVRYRNRLVERMRQLGFPPDDPLWTYGLRCRDELRGLLNIVRGRGVELRRRT